MDGWMRDKWGEKERNRWSDGCEGVQDKSPPNMSFWYEGYFELKAIKTLWVQEKLLSLP